MLADLALFFVEGLYEGSNYRVIVFLLGVFVSNCAKGTDGHWRDLR